jgi:hypothetical protein
MQSPKPVRTYLDADAVGPLPRFSHADDSDTLAAQRTIERPPTMTVELAPEDVLEIFDPKRPRNPSSIAPVGYDTVVFLPRRRLGNVVLGVVTAACLVIAAAAVRGFSRPQDSKASPAAAAAGATATGEPSTTRDPSAPSRPRDDTGASASWSAPTGAQAAQPKSDARVGTLRVDPQAEGHRVWVDGIVLTAEAALVRCGEHQVRVGSAGRTRTIDVPCGGEITVFR